MATSTYRVAALVRSTPDMAAGAGHLLTLEYNLTGVPEGQYPLVIDSVELYNTANASETGATLTNGAIDVNPAASISEWMVLED